jgi:hypothetical protein
VTSDRSPHFVKSGESTLTNHLPAVEQRGIDLVLVAERGDRDGLQQVLAEDGDLLLGGEMTAVGLGGWGLFHDGFLRCRILYQPAPVFPISSEALHLVRFNHPLTVSVRIGVSSAAF